MKHNLLVLITALVAVMLLAACAGTTPPSVGTASKLAGTVSSSTNRVRAGDTFSAAINAPALKNVAQISVATETPQAQETVTPQLPETFVAFDADFFDRPCPLFTGDDEIRAYACDFGEYYMLHKQAATRYSFYDVDYADAVIKANGYFNRGSGKYEYGIVFRASDDGSEYYVFTVTNDGRYNASVYKDGAYTDLIPYTSSPLVNTDEDGWNTFLVVMRGDTFDFYLNDEFLDTVTDDSIATGRAGLFLYNDTPDTEVGFDQFTISTFEPTATPTATPGSTASPTPDHTADIPESYVAFDADFFADTCPLFEGDNEVREYGCDFGEYYMLHKEATTRYSFYDERYDDGVLKATGFLNRGSGDFEYGVVFRASDDGSEYYVFVVTDDGRYNVALYQDDEYTDLIPYTSSPIVNTDKDGWNTFVVVMQGDKFDFYLNDEFLDTVTDDSIDSGVAGLFFYNAEPDTEVGFDRFTVSTFEPTATPTPGPTSELPETYVSFDADFFADDCPLFEGANDTREYGCALGEYYMLHKEATTRYSYVDQPFKNGVIEANGYFTSGSGNYEYGVVFRASDDGSEYYVFTVTEDGRYNVSLYQDEKYTDLIPYTSSSLVNTGDTANSFRVVMRGDRFDFYLNDEFLDTVTDDSIDSGLVGLFFYNDTPDTEVGFDQLTVSTFVPPPTETPETATPETTPTLAAAEPTVAVRPGLYVTGLRLAPGAPKRGEPVTFYATFLNTTGREQNYQWLVEVWEANTDKKNPYGQADHLERLIPAGTSERATGDSFKVAGGGPCVPFRAHVVFVDDQGRRVPFLRTNGTELWVPFQVCP